MVDENIFSYSWRVILSFIVSWGLHGGAFLAFWANRGVSVLLLVCLIGGFICFLIGRQYAGEEFDDLHPPGKQNNKDVQ